ncbi:MAG: hypothetical protein P8X89_13605 [Reinekea sp.]|jgi:hypothetical protein
MATVKATPAELEKGIKVKAGVRTQVTVSARELCIVVGSENHNNTYGLKMMFFAPAVRDLRMAKGQYDFFRLIYFADGYNNAEIEQVISSLNEMNVTLVAVNSADELLKELNLKSPVCKIERLNIYGHGVPLAIRFNYHGSSDDACSFNSKHVSGIDTSIFSSDAVIWSYACRTGNAVPDDYNPHIIDHVRHFPGDFKIDPPFETDADAKPQDSLAQAIANHTGKTVYAWLTRTLYERIWDDKGDSKYKKCFVDIPHNGIEGGWKRELKDWIPFSETDDKDDVVLWNQQGAKGGVLGGNTPKNLSNTARKFIKS